MTLPNLYVYHTFLELFKVLKTHIPVSLYYLFTKSVRENSLALHLPRYLLDISRNNFVFKSASLWNALITNVFEKCNPGKNGILVSGSVTNSDFCASVPFVKTKLREILLKQQALGDETIWTPENAFKS